MTDNESAGLLTALKHRISTVVEAVTGPAEVEPSEPAASYSITRLPSGSVQSQYHEYAVSADTGAPEPNLPEFRAESVDQKPDKGEKRAEPEPHKTTNKHEETNGNHVTNGEPEQPKDESEATSSHKESNNEESNNEQPATHTFSVAINSVTDSGKQAVSTIADTASSATQGVQSAVSSAVGAAGGALMGSESAQESSEQQNGSNSAAPNGHSDHDAADDDDDQHEDHQQTEKDGQDTPNGESAATSSKANGTSSEEQRDEKSLEKKDDKKPSEKKVSAEDIEIADSSAEDLKKHGKEWLDGIRQLYEQEEYIMAAKKFAELKKVLEKHKDQSLQKECQKGVYHLIDSFSDELLKLHDMFDMDKAEEKGFKSLSGKKDISVWYRDEKGSPLHTFSVSGDVDCNIFQVIAIIYEIDLLKTWLPGINVSRKIALEDSLFQFVVNIVVMRIFTIASRECRMYAYGDTDQDTHAITIYFRSMKKDDEYLQSLAEIPEIGKSHVEAILTIGGMQIIPREANKTTLSFICHGDPQLKYLPSWLLNFVTEKLCVAFFQKMRTLSKNMNKPAGQRGDSQVFVDRVQEQPGVYKEIVRRLKDHFPWLEKEVGKFLEQSKK